MRIGRALVAVCTVALSMAAGGVARGEVRTRQVEYHDGSQLCEGFVAYDDATTDDRPAVLICPEWWGMTDYPKHRAEQLAKMGFVAFVADIYGNGKQTDDPKEAGALAGPWHKDRAGLRRRATAALDTLTGTKYVDKTRVAAIGYCFGGTVALELARGGAPLVGVVSFHGDLSRTADEGPDDIKGRVLVCHGGADPVVPPEVLAAFEREMVQSHVDYQINVYGGAMHAFTNPAADAHHIPGIAYNAEADRRSWAAAKDFFAEAFGRV